METPTKDKKTDGRRKAWNRTGSGPDGLSRPIEPEQLRRRDIKTLEALEKYPYLDVDHLLALVGGKDRTRYVQRCRLLSDPPNNYIEWPLQQRRRINANAKNGIYGRARRGTGVLKRRGIHVSDNPYSEYNTNVEHQYYAHATFASIEIGGASLAVLHKKPIEISISRTFNGEPQAKTFHYMPDGFAAIEFENGLTGYLIIEVENENTVDRGNLEQASFIRKFLALRKIVQTEKYKSEWGFDNLLVLFISPYADKIDRMKRAVMRETRGHGAQYILFNEIIGWDHEWKSFKPRPEFFTGTWERTGTYAPWSLSTPPKAPKGETHGRETGAHQGTHQRQGEDRPGA